MGCYASCVGISLLVCVFCLFSLLAGVAWIGVSVFVQRVGFAFWVVRCSEWVAVVCGLLVADSGGFWVWFVIAVDCCGYCWWFW